MATSRYKPVVVLIAAASLACMSRSDSSAAAASAEASIQTIEIQHLTPRPDAVGPQPTILEWTAAAGVDSYTILVETEIDIPVFDQDNIKTTSVPWPKEIRVEPGTYFWRIAGMKGGRVIADSGRAAFVVREP